MRSPLRASARGKKGFKARYGQDSARLPKLRRRSTPRQKIPLWPLAKEVYVLPPEEKAMLERLLEKREKYVTRHPPELRRIWRICLDHCALCMLFNRDGAPPQRRTKIMEREKNLFKTPRKVLILWERIRMNCRPGRAHTDIAARKDVIVDRRDSVDSFIYGTDYVFVQPLGHPQLHCFDVLIVFLEFFSVEGLSTCFWPVKTDLSKTNIFPFKSNFLKVKTTMFWKERVVIQFQFA